MAKRIVKDGSITDDEICMSVTEKLYSKVTDIMHRCSDAVKCVFFFDLGHLFSEWNYPGIDIGKETLKMRWKSKEEWGMDKFRNVE